MSLNVEGTEMETAVDLATLDALFAAATPGEWTAVECHVNGSRWSEVETRPGEGDVIGCPVMTSEDAALIAALHNAWPAIRRRLAIGDAAVEVCDLTADLRSLWKAMGAGSDGAAEAYDQRLKAIDAARAKLRALRENEDA